MKLIIPHNTTNDQPHIDLWLSKARELSMLHGFHILVITKKENEVLTSIVFRIGEHEFESLLELKRALKMKTLL